MTDDLDALRAALKSAPAPNADAKARAMHLAMENFDRLQESTDPLRFSDDRPDVAAPLNGVRRMLQFLTLRPALAVTTSVAALLIGVAVIFPLPNLRTLPSQGLAPATEGEKPARKSDPQPAEAKPAPLSDTDDGTTTAVPPIKLTPPGDPSKAADPLARAAETVAPTPEPVINGGPTTIDPLAGEAQPPIDNPLGALEGPATEERPPLITAGGATRGQTALPDLESDGSDFIQPLPPSTEAYSTAPANPVKVTVEEPVSTFSIDVDTASWAVIRSTLNLAMLPTPDQVRIEEMVNYFPYAYPAPAADQAFSTNVSVMPTPWNPGTRLVTIGIQGALPQVEARPPLNLVFLIDTSGSMEDANKLPLLQQSLSLMLSELRPEDQIAIVAYAGSAGLVLPPTKAQDRDTILGALDALYAGGSTAGAEGLELAYQVAESMKAEGEVTRILLATDGDFNVGISDPDALEDYVAQKRESGTYLSVLGFGRGNLDDTTMQALAQNGNGQAAYIDTLSEARKVLVDQLTGALFPIADDVKIQVEWNPATVAEYRLIGYETRSLRREDFNNDKVDAGEIGAGTQVTAIYEVTAPGSEALLNDTLRYGKSAETEGTAGELGFLRLRWKAPGAETSTLIETPITGNEEATTEARFAAAIAGFGQLLQNSVYTGDWGWDQAIDLALANRGDDPFGYRTEAVNLMRLAKSLDR